MHGYNLWFTIYYCGDVTLFVHVCEQSNQCNVHGVFHACVVISSGCNCKVCLCLSSP